MAKLITNLLKTRNTDFIIQRSQHLFSLAGLKRSFLFYNLCGIIIFSAFLLTSCSGSKEEQKCGIPGYLIDSLNPTPGYVLIAPAQDTLTYLIDKKGDVQHCWTSNYTPGLSVHLLENGNLLRTETLKPEQCCEGGGRVAMYDWDSELLWGYNIKNDSLQQSHDAYPMPNGNVLVVVWELIPKQEVIDAGRTNCPSKIYSGMLIELQQSGDTAINVWQWRFWDHLVSDQDSVAANPQLLNVNYIGSPLFGEKDWIHMNAVSYNAALDQIMISSRNLNEIYIIDHSTTTAEAASHSGGIYGKGGDFLYRWGNPAAYNLGDASQQQFFGQHSPYWLNTSDVDSSKIMINNDGFRGIYNSSCPTASDTIPTTFNIVNMPYNPDSLSYGMEPNKVCEPSKPSWTGISPPPKNTYSSYIEGSVQLLSNGNILACASVPGTLYEMDTTTSQVVWQYQVNGGSFRCHQFDTAYIEKIVKEQSLRSE